MAASAFWEFRSVAGKAIEKDPRRQAVRGLHNVEDEPQLQRMYRMTAKIVKPTPREHSP